MVFIRFRETNTKFDLVFIKIYDSLDKNQSKIIELKNILIVWTGD